MSRLPAPAACMRQSSGTATAEVRDSFAAYRTDPEAVWAIASLADADPPLWLGIAAVGGGTVGRAYASNDWIYGLWLAGRLQLNGADLHSGSIGKTHHQMAVLLCEFLAEDASLDEQTRNRLAVWAHQQDADPLP